MNGPAGTFADADLPGAQGRLAFTALIVERRPLSRDVLADIVWSQRLPTQWNSSLSAIVSKIKALMLGIGLDSTDLVTSVGGTYEIQLAADSWVDLEDAYRRLDRAAGALRQGDIETSAREATVASAILRRSLLAGVESDWLDGQRRRQHDALHRCLAVLAESWIRLGDHTLAATVSEAAIRTDPLREIGHRLLIRAEIGRGDRGAALTALARCERILVDELGVSPSPETQQLAEQLRF